MQAKLWKKKQSGNFEAAKQDKQVSTFYATYPDKLFLKCVQCFEKFHKKNYVYGICIKMEYNKALFNLKNTKKFEENTELLLKHF